MEQINLYNIKKKELLQAIQQAATMMERLNMSKEGGMCTSLYKRLREDTFKVVIMGEFKVGKSTFINAMLGSGDILPAKATPCTAVINEVKYSKEHYAIIYFKHPIPSPLPKLAPNIKKYIESFQGKRIAPIKVDAKYLSQFVVIDDEVDSPDEEGKEGIAQTPFSKAEIFWDLPICEQGVEFIDTPGLNENETRTNVTLNYLTQADAIIFVLDCTRPLSKTERQSIENDVVGKGHQYVFYVCNKINLVKEKERPDVIERMMKELSHKTKLGEEGIFCINAEDAKDGRAENDQEKFAQSGMAEFEAQLDNVLANKRGTIKLLQPARQLESAIEYALATAIPNERKMLELSTQELDQRLQKEVPNLQRLKHEKELLTEQIDNEVRKICRDTELLLQNRYNEIVSQLPKWIDSIRCDSTISLNPLKLKQSIRPYSEELIEKLQNKLTEEQTDWQNRQLQPFVISRLQEMAKKYESNITRIFVDIEKIKLRITGVDDVETPSNLERIGAIVAGLFGGGVSGAIVGGSLGFSKEFAATIAAHIAIYLVLGGLLGATNPITLIALAATTIGGLVFGAVKVEDKIRKKVAEQVIAQIRKDSDGRISEGVKVLKDKLNQGAVNFSTAIDKELHSVEQLVEKIKRDKQAGEQRVKESIVKLEQDKAAFQGLLTNIQALIKSMEEKDIEFEPVHDGSPAPDETSRQEEPVLPPLQPEVPQPPQVPQPHQEPHDNSTLISCPNPQCPNYGKKVLAPTTNFCPKCGARIGEVPPPPSSEPSYFIDPDKDMCEIEGVTYCRVDATCPKCQSSDRTHWIHADDNCGGEMYIGDNAHIVCGKCGKEKKANYWKLLCVKHDNVESHAMTCIDEEQGLDIPMKFAGEISKKTGMKWLGLFFENLEKSTNI